ncbi:MAG: hypothetical protein M3Y26_00765 [Actinomycetota bacterium]|nr:hypothetical protein [Actinomycetota bacterium]
MAVRRQQTWVVTDGRLDEGALRPVGLRKDELNAAVAHLERHFDQRIAGLDARLLSARG